MKKAFSILGMIFGGVIVVMGIIVLTMDMGTHLDTASFGGDFYTYSYKATRAAANNVYYLEDIVRKGIGFLLIALGLTDICAFGSKLGSDRMSPVVAVSADEVAVEEDELPDL